MRPQKEKGLLSLPLEKKDRPSKPSFFYLAFSLPTFLFASHPRILPIHYLNVTHLRPCSSSHHTQTNSCRQKDVCRQKLKKKPPLSLCSKNIEAGSVGEAQTNKHAHTQVPIFFLSFLPQRGRAVFGFYPLFPGVISLR